MGEYEKYWSKLEYYDALKLIFPASNLTQNVEDSFHIEKMPSTEYDMEDATADTSHTESKTIEDWSDVITNSPSPSTSSASPKSAPKVKISGRDEDLHQKAISQCMAIIAEAQTRNKKKDNLSIFGDYLAGEL